MPESIYPIALPNPVALPMQPDERRLLSEIEGPRQFRAVQRDYGAQVQAQWVLTRRQAGVFERWWREDLLRGGVAFSARWPWPGRSDTSEAAVFTFAGAPRWELVDGALWRVTATLRLRGRGRPPQRHVAPPAAQAQVVVTAREYQFVEDDTQRMVQMVNSQTMQAEIAHLDDADVPLGSAVFVRQGGEGAVLIVPGAADLDIPPSRSAILLGRGATARAVKVGANRWALSGELQPAQDSILTVYSAMPGQGEILCTHPTVTGLVAPDPASFGMWRLRQNFADELQNFANIVPFGTSTPTFSGGGLRLQPSQNQAARLPQQADNSAAYFNALGLLGSSGDKSWSISMQVFFESMPTSRAYLFHIGPQASNVTAYVLPNGDVVLHTKNGSGTSSVTLAAGVVAGAWFGFCFSHENLGSGVGRLRILSADGRSAQVEGALFYYLPAADVAIEIGRGRVDTSAFTYSAIRVRDVHVRNGTASEPAIPNNVMDLIRNVEGAFDVTLTNRITGEVVSTYPNWLRTTPNVLFSVPSDLAPGAYYARAMSFGQQVAGPSLFVVDRFHARTTPLLIDMTSTSHSSREHIDGELVAAHQQWGGLNGGVRRENCIVDWVGRTIDMIGCGDQYTGPLIGVDRNGNDNASQTTRIGGCLVTRSYFGPGRYRAVVRFPVPTGVVSAMWTFHYEEGYPGHPTYRSIEEDGIRRQGDLANGYYNVRNHEIDIEIPTALKTDPDPEVVSYGNARLNTWRGELRNWDVAETDPNYWTEYTDDWDPLPYAVNDGQWHEIGFDWHLGSDPRVEFYLDGQLLRTTRTTVPDIPQQLWLGVWFPSAPGNHWAGRDAAFDTVRLSMRSLRVEPFADEYPYLRLIGETYPLRGRPGVWGRRFTEFS